MSRFRVVKDTREQKGWTFEETDYCEGQDLSKLDTGDYTIRGLEDILCIERKANIGELAANLVSARFDKELERMMNYKYRYLICEIDFKEIMHFPNNMPPTIRYKIKTSNTFLLKRINEIGLDINVVFVGKYGKEYTLSLFKRLWERYLKA